MKKALYQKKLEDNKAQCLLCPHNCIIKSGKKGFCQTRKNVDGQLYALTYDKPISISIDPIEKKPLYHFYPGSKILSIGTLGCNLRCKNCQNCDIAHTDPEEYQIEDTPPQQIIQAAQDSNCQLIAFTYTEPTIFYEYMLEIAKLAKEENIKCVIVSNGYINPKPLKKLAQYIHAANIDLKGFSDEFYKKVCLAKSFKPVLETMKILKENDVWLEITNLIIPGYNDDEETIEKMSSWIKNNLGKNTPLHLSRFFPYNKMNDIQPTPVKTLDKAYQIAKKHLNFVYEGNIEKNSNTYCPSCDKLLIERTSFYTTQNHLEKGKCPSCQKKIAGIFH